MKMQNVVIFDLFGTILIEESHNWNNGLKHIFDMYLDTDDFNEVLSVAKMFKDRNMNNRSITYEEPKMIDQIKLFQRQFGFIKETSIDDVEFEFLEHSRVVSLNKGVKEVLDYLKKESVEIYIMTNTIYSSKAIRRYLDKLEVAEYVTNIFTSSDFGYRKPHMGFYDYVFSKVNYNNSLERKDIIFIGDNLTKDAIAGRDFGFRTVLLNGLKDSLIHIDKRIIITKNMLDFKQFLVDEFIYISGFLNNYSISDGPGNRLVLFFQGCKRHCKGCQNEKSWNRTEGKRIHIEDLVIDVLHKLNKYTRNITVSGGEPLDQKSQLISFLKKLKNFEINICLYTGYEFDEVDLLILENIDYIKTGEYIENEKNTTNGYYGSSNQNMKIKGEDGK